MPAAAVADVACFSSWEQPEPAAAPPAKMGGPPPPAAGARSRAPMCVAAAAMICSIPALVGSWCWPLLLAGAFSSLVSLNTSGSRAFLHTLTWGMNLAVFTNMLQFAFVRTRRQRKDMACCRKWGPFLCMFLAMLLSMADPTRHAILDAWGAVCEGLASTSVLGVRNSTEGQWHVLSPEGDAYCYYRSLGLSMYKQGDLSVVGWIFTVLCTWSGFVLLFVGIFWLINLPAKVVARWRAIRAQQLRARGADLATREGSLESASNNSTSGV